MLYRFAVQKLYVACISSGCHEVFRFYNELPDAFPLSEYLSDAGHRETE